jgi:hypothetical protein
MPSDEPTEPPSEPAVRPDEAAEPSGRAADRGGVVERGGASERGGAAERSGGERGGGERGGGERGGGERGGGAERGEREGDRLSETIRARLEHLVPELVRKTFTAGLGAVYSTEEGIRKIAKDINLPDVAGYLASSADATKDRVLEVVARETREFLEHINLGEEIAKLLTTLSFEIKTEIRFIPNSERFVGSEPEVKASVRLKRVGDDDKDGKDGKDKDAKDGDGRSRLRFWRRDDDGEDKP